MLKSALINQAGECNYGEEEIANTGKIYKVDKGSSESAIPILNFQGSKGNSVADVSDTMYSLNAMHGHDVHCVVDVNVPRHSTESGVEGEGAAEGAEGSSGSGGAICIQGSMIGRSDKNGPQGNGINIDKSFTLNTTDRHAIAVRTAQTGANGIGVSDEKTHTLDGANGQAVAYKNFTQSSFGGYQEGVGTLRASGGDLGGGSETIVYENHALEDL